MKTFGEIHSEMFNKIYTSPEGWPLELTQSMLAEMAAKEYAKMWIDKATDELNDYGVGFPEAYKRVAALRKQIDNQ